MPPPSAATASSSPAKDLSVSLTQDVVNNADVIANGNLSYGTTGKRQRQLQQMVGLWRVPRRRRLSPEPRRRVRPTRCPNLLRAAPHSCPRIFQASLALPC